MNLSIESAVFAKNKLMNSLEEIENQHEHINQNIKKDKIRQS